LSQNFNLIAVERSLAHPVVMPQHRPPNRSSKKRNSRKRKAQKVTTDVFVAEVLFESSIEHSDQVHGVGQFPNVTSTNKPLSFNSEDHSEYSLEQHCKCGRPTKSFSNSGPRSKRQKLEHFNQIVSSQDPELVDEFALLQVADELIVEDGP